MQKRFVRFMTIFLTLFLAINYYVGLRGWQWVNAVSPGLSPWIYWVPFWLVAFSFVLPRFTRNLLPTPLRSLLMNTGALWLPVMFYALLLLLLIDTGRLLATWFGLLGPAAGAALHPMVGALVLAVLGLVLVYGVWRARTPVVVPYEVTIAKPGGKHRELHIVFVSDTHLGTINRKSRLQQMVAMVNQLKPDLVLHGGDMLDDEMGPFLAQQMPAELKRLHAPLGAFAVLGNHDYPDGLSDGYRQALAGAGMRLLIDEWVKVDESFYLIGRNDVSGRMRGGGRQPLAELIQDLDHSLPLIVIDHQPYQLGEAEAAGIDLQVSGHTHRGQIFPNNYLTRRVWELDWGYLKKGATHVIVSLGFGTWGPPVRIGNRPEVVSIRVRFS